MKDDRKLVLCCIGMVGGGVLAGWGLRSIKESIDSKNFNASVATVLSLYKDGLPFDHAMVEYLKKNGFDDRYMFR